ncbi:molybdopterin-dependent oxidoreductase [Rhodobacter maris]|uniref:Oxidoreductase molybdopterin-binding domain-containing protein n=1 Tax=Rhodobacter maris TaxID=446682 RepID=A0A285SQA2_9RHOB|nr:molybdopterin-dependent oxidoreductase [Rhodobacter maris]SOC10410.1 hypothetical protein SAMN05877831_10862 [Rhodobacter maris]
MQQLRLTARFLTLRAVAVAAIALPVTLVNADAPPRITPMLPSATPFAAENVSMRPTNVFSPDPVAPLGAPKGKILLTVTGALGTGNAPALADPVDKSGATQVVQFDDAMLGALPRAEFATSTIWTSGESRFSGVPLREVLARLGVHAGQIRVIALNDYAVEIPLAELADEAPLLADRRNGQPMSIREKGPLWIVYPYDADPSYRNEVIYARSVWQVDRIEVLP